MNINVLCFPAEDKSSGKWRVMVMTRTTQGINEVVKVMIVEGEYESEDIARMTASVLQSQFLKAVQKNA